MSRYDDMSAIMINLSTMNLKIASFNARGHKF